MDHFGRVMWWLFLTSAGSDSRVRIVQSLRQSPKNAQQLTRVVQMHYGTVRHHLKVLEANHLIDAVGNPYGRVYFPSQPLEAHWKEFDRIVEAGRGKGRTR